MYKKITLVLLAAVLTASSALAQELGLGIQAGLNYADFYGLHSPESTKKPGIQLGVVIGGDQRMWGNFSVQTGLLFVQQGAKGDELFERKVTSGMTLNYLRIPINLRYHIDFGNSMGLYLQAGCYYGYALSGRVKVINRDGSESRKIDFNESNMNRWDMGVGLGAGLKVMDNINIGISKDWGIVSLIKSQGVTYLFANTNFALTATYFLPSK